MTLQQKPSKIETDPGRYLTLIHGAAGIGKTSFGAQIKGHYFIITEMGTEGVSVFGDAILSWKEFVNKCSEIVKARDAGWKDEDDVPQREITTLVIDTYENLYSYAAKWVCENTAFPEKGVQQRFDRIEDVPYGKGYKRTNELIIEKLNKLRLLGFGVLVISHTKGRTTKWRGQDFESYGPNLPPSAAQGIVDACGAVGYFSIEEKTFKNEDGQVVKAEEGRYMTWQPSFLITAKHRLPGFPKKLPLEKDTGYKTYLEAFQKAVSNEGQKKEKEKGEITHGESK